MELQELFIIHNSLKARLNIIFGNTCFNEDYKSHLYEYNKRDIYRLLNYPGHILFYNDFFKTYEILGYSESTGDYIRISNFSKYAYPIIAEYYLAYNINIFNCEETGVCSWIPFNFSSNVYTYPEIFYDSTSGTFIMNNLRTGFKL